MRIITIILGCLLALAASAQEPTGKILKVLPHYLDSEGRHALAPSLYERDAYQDFLRNNPEKRATIRYDVNWKAGKVKGPLTMKLELRGSDVDKKPIEFLLEREVRRRGFGSQWSGLALENSDFARFNKILAWRVSIWDGTALVAEQKSFLW